MPHNDILLYWPVADLWMSGGKGEKRFAVHDPSWIEGTPCGDAAHWLLQHGHSFDFVSDAQIAKTRAEPGPQPARLITQGGSSYQTLLVDHKYKKFDASNWPLQPSGLLGPVQLIPMATE